jgi:excisionase family DNA binding protein
MTIKDSYVPFDERYTYAYNPGIKPTLKESCVMATSKGDEILTTKEVADELKVSERRVRKWIRDGDLIATDLGRDYRIYRRDLDDFISKRRTKSN